MYLHGNGTEKNDAKAFEWMKKSAAQGNGKAQSYLAYMYEKGRGTKKDLSEASKWYQKAANSGNAVTRDWLNIEFL